MLFVYRVVMSELHAITFALRCLSRGQDLRSPQLTVFARLGLARCALQQHSSVPLTGSKPSWPPEGTPVIQASAFVAHIVAHMLCMHGHCLLIVILS